MYSSSNELYMWEMNGWCVNAIGLINNDISTGLHVANDNMLAEPTSSK